MAIRTEDDDKCLYPNGVVPDGGTVRSRLQLSNAMQRDVAHHFAGIRMNVAGYQSINQGSAVIADADLATAFADREGARNEKIHTISNARKYPPAQNIADARSPAQGTTVVAADAQKRRDDAWEETVLRTENAWRSPNAS